MSGHTSGWVVDQWCPRSFHTLAKTIPVPVAGQSVASSRSCEESYEQFEGGVQHTSIDDLFGTPMIIDVQ